MSTVKRAPIAVKIAWFIAAVAASCALPSYDIERHGDTSGDGDGGQGASGSFPVTGSGGSGQGGQDGAGGQGGADDKDAGDQSDADASPDAGTCKGDICPIDAKAGDPCPCQDSFRCLINKCNVMGGGEAHALVCKLDMQQPGKFIWLDEQAKLQCCPKAMRPCLLGQGEVCLVKGDAAEGACVKTDCGVNGMVCSDCGNDLCNGEFPVCQVNGGVVNCKAP